MNNRVKIIGKASARYYYAQIDGKYYLLDLIPREDFFNIFSISKMSWRISEIDINDYEVKPLSQLQANFKKIDGVCTTLLLTYVPFNYRRLMNFAFGNSFIIATALTLIYSFLIILFFFFACKSIAALEQELAQNTKYLVLFQKETSPMKRKIGAIFYYLCLLFIILFASSLKLTFLSLVLNIVTPISFLLTPYLMVNQKFKNKRISITPDLSKVQEYEKKYQAHKAKPPMSKTEKRDLVLSILGVVLFILSLVMANYQQVNLALIALPLGAFLITTYPLNRAKRREKSDEIDEIRRKIYSSMVGSLSTIRFILGAALVVNIIAFLI